MPSSPDDSLDEDGSPVGSSPPASLAARSTSLTMRQRDGVRSVSGAKRKRADTSTTARASSQRRRLTQADESDESEEEQEDSDEPSGEDEDDDAEMPGSDESEEEQEDSDEPSGEDDDDDAEMLGSDDDVYDPDQPVEERRKVQRGLRGLLRNVTEKSEEYLQQDSRGLRETIRKANSFVKDIKRPSEAASDSRLLISTTDLSYRKTLRLTHGSLAQGLDVDEFVSKCVTYMRQGRGIDQGDAPELSSTQRRRRVSHVRDEGDGDQDETDEGDMMNWAHLGRFGALPYIKRPALPGFMLGPLSVEKKLRKVTKRVAPLRPNSLTETRPEVLSVGDLAKKENDLTAICGKILHQLQRTQAEVQNTVVELIDDDMSDAERTRIMHKHGLRSTGGIDLMRFVVNPRSFGQTVENMFYVSFLIRDGRVEIEYDESDLPALAPVQRDAEGEPRSRSGASKHQAILSMDMDTWQDIKDTLKLTEPMIAHREEGSSHGPGASGWYS